MFPATIASDKFTESRRSPRKLKETEMGKTVYDLCVEAGLKMSKPQKDALHLISVESDHGSGYMPGFMGIGQKWVRSFVETYYDPKYSSRFEGAIVVWSHLCPNRSTMVHHFMQDGTVRSGMMIS